MSPREIEGEVQECAKCGWRHRPSQACPKSKPPTGQLGAKVAAVAGVDPLEKFKEWEVRAQAQPMTREPAGRTCPVCAQPILVCRNFLGVVWEEVGDETWEEHQGHCTDTPVAPLPELQRPRRAGLPYKDSE